jgi:hypothetical protein
MRRIGQTLGILGVALAAAACGSSGSGTIPTQPAAPLQSAAADHMRLDMMRLRLDDLGPNWRRESAALGASDSSKCDPRPKDVKITAGSWKSRGVSYGFGTTAQIHSDAIVFASVADAQKTLAANMKPSVIQCVKRELVKEFRSEKSSVKLLGISTSVLHPHPVGDQLSGIRLKLNLAKGKQPFKFFLDAFIVRQDRALAEFSYMNAFRPVPSSTELTLAQAIAQRGALTQ